MTAIGSCDRCTRTLYPQRAWAVASPDQRTRWLTNNGSVHQGRGLCRGCYLKAWKAGDIEHTRPGVGGRGNRTTHTAPHPCGRCGITTTRTDTCRDCQEVEAA